MPEITVMLPQIPHVLLIQTLVCCVHLLPVPTCRASWSRRLRSWRRGEESQRHRFPSVLCCKFSLDPSQWMEGWKKRNFTMRNQLYTEKNCYCCPFQWNIYTKSLPKIFAEYHFERFPRILNKFVPKLLPQPKPTDNFLKKKLQDMSNTSPFHCISSKIILH